MAQHLRNTLLEKINKNIKTSLRANEKIISFRKVDILLHNTEVKIRKCCVFYINVFVIDKIVFLETPSKGRKYEHISNC